MKRIALLLVFVAACGSRDKAADTTATLPPPDTVKPAPPVDTAESTRAAQTKTGETKSTRSGTKTGVAGRDSVIRMPLKTLPLPDTTKRPPDSAKVIGRDSVIRMPLKTLPLPDTTKTKRPD